MACCAFAAFIISQLILGWNTLRTRLGFTVDSADSDNPNAAWTFGLTQTLPFQERGRIFPIWLAVSAGAVAIGALTGAIWLGDAPSAHFSQASAWCRSTPVLESLPSPY